MNLKITSGDGSVLDFSQGLPPALEQYALPGVAALSAIAPFGKMIFHELKGGGFTVVHSLYICEKDVTLEARLGEPVLEFQLACRNSARFHRQGLGEVILQERQFNLFYTPFWETSCDLRHDQEYTTLVIIFDVPFLERLSPYFPYLDRFLIAVREGRSVVLSDTAGRANPQMMGATHDICFNDFAAEVKNIYVEGKVMEVLIQALDKIGRLHGTPATPFTLKSYDLEKIKEAAELLRRKMDVPITIVELARRVGLNDYKLKKGFKQVYGTTIFNFFLGIRMEKAKTLISETNLPITDIAYMTGYKNESNFSTAFRKTFATSPKSLRKG